MLIDTHCHLNMMVKKEFDTLLEPSYIDQAAAIIKQAYEHEVTKIINVGTSLIESKNCVTLASVYASCYATVGIHPNDCTATWLDDLKEMRRIWFHTNKKNYKELKIVGIGECGIDRHYPDYNLQRQKDAFKAHIELALEFDLPLSVHSRNAPDETLTCLDEFRKEKLRGVIHCFSEDEQFALEARSLGMVLGIGGTITYPKNNTLRTLVAQLPDDAFILETDAPFLPPQTMRGKQNTPAQIKTVAQFIAELRNQSYDKIAHITSTTAQQIFNLP